MSDLDYDGYESDRSGHDDSDHREVSESSPEKGEVIDCAAVGNASTDLGSSLGLLNLQMCSKHKPGSMVEVCKVCSAVLTMVRPEVAKQLLAPVTVQCQDTRADLMTQPPL